MNERRLYNWQKVSIFNLFLVSCLGLTLRYKILFPLPFIDQKFLLHAHSHFAFSGWVTQILMTFIVKHLYAKKPNLGMKKYRYLLWLNLISAYGMLVSFPFQGYGPISITFSTLSIFVSYAFAFAVWRDLKDIGSREISHHWFKASLLFNVISSLGAFSLAFMMANKIIDQTLSLEAIYFFLHFQYNGWFFFACMGLFLAYMKQKNIVLSPKINRWTFWLFFCAAIPAYFLSVLWLPIPQWMYVTVIIAAVVQCVGYFIFVRHLLQKADKIAIVAGNTGKWLWLLVSVALSIKLLLQLVSVIPSLSQLTVGFRPIVIGYLHLVLLGVITIFLLGYFVVNNSPEERKFFSGINAFVTGIILNEILLMAQGISSLLYVTVPFINEMLLMATLVMFTGLFLLNVGLHSKTPKETVPILTS